jgi:hypothetical protein
MLQHSIPASSNGRRSDSESRSRGSNPWVGATTSYREEAGVGEGIDSHACSERVVVTVIRGGAYG